MRLLCLFVFLVAATGCGAPELFHTDIPTLQPDENLVFETGETWTLVMEVHNEGALPYSERWGLRVDDLDPAVLAVHPSEIWIDDPILPANRRFFYFDLTAVGAGASDVRISFVQEDCSTRGDCIEDRDITFWIETWDPDDPDQEPWSLRDLDGI